MELPDEDMQIQIAQFTLDFGASPHDGTFSYQGTASYNLEGGNLTSQAFSIALPGPGALALLGLAGLRRGRHR